MVRYDTDSWGNRVGYLEVRAPAQEQITLREEFDLTRSEIQTRVDPSKTRALTDPERIALARYLAPSTHVVVNDRIKALSASIVGGETNPILAARKIYDWTFKNIDYWVKDPDHLKASPVGSTEYCMMSKTGNCTDFHSLFASLAMAAGLPTRLVYGSLLKPSLNGIEVDASYHCWVQFYAPQTGWVPLDASLANIYGKDFPLTDKNKKLVELTTATGYKGEQGGLLLRQHRRATGGVVDRPRFDDAASARVGAGQRAHQGVRGSGRQNLRGLDARVHLPGDRTLTGRSPTG